MVGRLSECGLVGGVGASLRREVLLRVEPPGRGVFVRRLSRVSALVRVEGCGEPQKAHLTNTGRLREVLYPGGEVLLIPIDGVKTRWRIVGVPVGGEWASLLDTRLQEEAVAAILGRGLLSPLKGWKLVQRHPMVEGGMRFDFLLEKDGRRLWVETKSAVYYFPEDGSARYPDTVSLRGRRHLRFAIEHAGEVVVLFVVADPRATHFAPSEDDPILAELIREAKRCGVSMYAVKIGLHIPDGSICLLGRALEVRV